ncbi:tail completion protein gp17 [Paenibacillus cymbidii]|uniref:tail completion protein gp17 n=1 Tax=Paenibacillus cymbidii TaxID=1639034 RepID=UPI00107FEE1C|nr:DUF3168 domain-containing protein [Paenibacillus cymbidii]
MLFETAMTAELTAITGLTDKVHHLKAPESARVPYVEYESSEGLATKTMGGYQAGKSVEVELNVVAGTYGSLKQVTAAVVAKLASFEGRLIGTSGPFIQEITLRASREFYDKETKLMKSALSFEVYF